MKAKVNTTISRLCRLFGVSRQSFYQYWAKQDQLVNEQRIVLDLVRRIRKGHPVIGDPVYGRSRRKGLMKLPEATQVVLTEFHRQALHARLIGFTHPETAEYMRFESEFPNDVNLLFRALALI